MTSQSGIPMILPNSDEPSADPAKAALPWNTMFGALALSVPICSVLYSVILDGAWLFSGNAYNESAQLVPALVENLLVGILDLLVVISFFAIVFGIPIVIVIEATLRRLTSRRLHLLAHFGASAIAAGILVSVGIIPGFVFLGGGWQGSPTVWQKIGIVALFAVITGAGAALSWLSADAIARRRAPRAIPSV